MSADDYDLRLDQCEKKRDTILSLPPVLVFPTSESRREAAAVRGHQHDAHRLPQMQLEPGIGDISGHPRAQ